MIIIAKFREYKCSLTVTFRLVREKYKNTFGFLQVLPKKTIFATCFEYNIGMP